MKPEKTALEQLREVKESDWNKRPFWCPHKDCKYMRDMQGMACIGKLPNPEPHDNDFNTHRFCIDTRETGHGIFDLQLNHTDAYLFRSLLKDI